MEISSRQFHLGKFGDTQKGANGSLVWTALNNEVQSPEVSVHVSLFCTPKWPQWRYVKTIYNPLSFLLCFKLLLPPVGFLFTVVLVTVDVTFVVFAFIVVSASAATVVAVLGVTYSLPAKESHFLFFLNNLKGHIQLMHMRIRYHILADLHVTRRARSLNHRRRFTVEKAWFSKYMKPFPSIFQKCIAIFRSPMYWFISFVILVNEGDFSRPAA